MPFLTTLVDSVTKTRFVAIAKARGLSESELLRSLALAGIGADEDADRPIKPDAAKAELARITVRMPRFLMEATIERAKVKGMAVSRFITAIVQSNLMRQPVMTNVELSGLLASSRDLVAVGRNVNQIARAINRQILGTGTFDKDTIKLIALAKLSQAVQENEDAIRVLVRASQESWDA